MNLRFPRSELWVLDDGNLTPEHPLRRLELGVDRGWRVERLTLAEGTGRISRKESCPAAILVSTWHACLLARRYAERFYASPPPIYFIPAAKRELPRRVRTRRWKTPVLALAAHPAEEAALAIMRVPWWGTVRLAGRLQPAAIPSSPQPTEQALEIGVAWYNVHPDLREGLLALIARCESARPGGFRWILHRIADFDEPPMAVEGTSMTWIGLAEGAAAATPADVVLRDAWWPGTWPMLWEAPVQLLLASFSASEGRVRADWDELLARLLALAELRWSGRWDEASLSRFQWGPFRQSLEEWELPSGEPRAQPARPDFVAPDPAWLGYQAVALDARGDRLAAALAAWREHHAHEDEHEVPVAALDWYFRLYDYALHVRWIAMLYRRWGLAPPKRREAVARAALAVFQALPLQQTTSAHVLKRQLREFERLACPDLPRPRPNLRWLRWLFAFRHPWLAVQLLLAVFERGRAAPVPRFPDPLQLLRALATRFLEETGIRLVRHAPPAPREPRTPTLYLLNHRETRLDPLLLALSLPDPLTLIISRRARPRWFTRRLAGSPSFLLTGRQRGVAIADAIAALRGGRALALFPEATEPTSLGEGGPLREGVLGMVQALDACQVVPVAFADPFALVRGGPREVEVHVGAPIRAGQATGPELLLRVRLFFQRRVPGTVTALDLSESPMEPLKSPPEASESTQAPKTPPEALPSPADGSRPEGSHPSPEAPAGEGPST